MLSKGESTIAHPKERPQDRSAPQSRVLVAVLSFNKRDRILECLASLERRLPPPGPVVVFDNGSTDGSQSAIRAAHPDVDLVCSDENLGAIRGRNAAFAHAAARHRFDYVLFLDDDAAVAEDAVALLVDALDRAPEAAIACGKTHVDLDSDVLMSAGIRVRLGRARCHDRGAGEKDRGQLDEDAEVDACGGFAMMVRRPVFEALDGFDPVFDPYGWEDVDLCLRARRLGHRTRYVHRARFAHKGTRLGRGPLPRYERTKARNFLVLLRRHASWHEKASASVFLPLRGLLLVAGFAVRGHWAALAALIRGVGDFLQVRRRSRPQAD